MSLTTVSNRNFGLFLLSLEQQEVSSDESAVCIQVDCLSRRNNLVEHHSCSRFRQVVLSGYIFFVIFFKQCFFVLSSFMTESRELCRTEFKLSVRIWMGLGKKERDTGQVWKL